MNTPNYSMHLAYTQGLRSSTGTIINLSLSIANARVELSSHHVDAALDQLLLPFDILMADCRCNPFTDLRADCKFKEFSSRLSLPIIDMIDKMLAMYRRFMDKKLNFIINCDIKYRMGRDAEEE